MTLQALATPLFVRVVPRHRVYFWPRRALDLSVCKGVQPQKMYRKRMNVDESDSGVQSESP
jgi:hypothetical protein